MKGSARPSELVSDEAEVPCGSVESPRELGGAGKQQTEGTELEDDAEEQSSRKGVGKTSQDKVPSPDDPEGHVENASSGSEEQHTRDGESGVESGYVDASCEESGGYTSVRQTILMPTNPPVT